MNATAHLSVGIALLAGLVSFVSPCVLPLVPAYLSFLTGTSLDELRTSAPAPVRARAVAHALAFVTGFTVVFVALGLSAGSLGSLLGSNRVLVARIGGIVVILLGLHMTGLLRIPLLMYDARAHVQPARRGYLTSAIVGIAFAAGWSPCIGPILAGILALASQERTLDAAGLLLAYSAGLAVPFLAAAVALGAIVPLMDRIKRFLPAIEIASGCVLIAAGVVLLTDSFLRIAGWFYQFVPQPSL
jgi:cytochrome c-type biogenesis protein